MIEVRYRDYNFKLQPPHRIYFKHFKDTDYEIYQFEDIKGSIRDTDDYPVLNLIPDPGLNGIRIIKENSEYLLMGDDFNSILPTYIIKKLCTKCEKYHTF